MDKKQKMSGSSWDLSTDALVEILVRLPSNVRRRLRLVCRYWRELIDQHTATDMGRRTKILATTTNNAWIVDLLTPGSERSLWQQEGDHTIRADKIVGTCNGLVCLCDAFTVGGHITVTNPSTNEVLRLPPRPMPGAIVRHDRKSWWWWHKTYNFTYCPTTGRYKVVHVPCRHYNPSWNHDIVHVFTLGEASWRDVHVDPGANCSLESSLVDVDGVIYWLTKDTGKIMSFDLKHERMRCTEPLPVAAMPSTCRLTKVYGRLGLVVGGDDASSVMVWVLEGESWIRRYFLEANKPRQREVWMMRELVAPHFIYGDYFLTFGSSLEVLQRHRMSDMASSQDGVVQKKHGEPGVAVTRLPQTIYQTFSYIQTNEPLCIYNVSSVSA